MKTAAYSKQDKRKKLTKALSQGEYDKIHNMYMNMYYMYEKKDKHAIHAMSMYSMFIVHV